MTSLMKYISSTGWYLYVIAMFSHNFSLRYNLHEFLLEILVTTVILLLCSFVAVACFFSFWAFAPCIPPFSCNIILNLLQKKINGNSSFFFSPTSFLKFHRINKSSLNSMRMYCKLISQFFLNSPLVRWAIT